MDSNKDLGIRLPVTLLPRAGIDLHKWAVVACDQYTAEPDYWHDTERLVGDAPSTLHLIYPEAYLGSPGHGERIARIQTKMAEYLDSGVLEPHEGLIYVERTIGGVTRKGLLLCLDLERYDYGSPSTSLIRPTEQTIVERLAPRIDVRVAAPLELPHVLALIDDPEHSVIETVARAKEQLQPLYAFELMRDGGTIAGYGVRSDVADRVMAGLAELARPERFAARYGVGREEPVMLVAVGDGNHSLAAAKAMWERIKLQVGPEHPARYSLVELENIHDPGLHFAPIHRVLFGTRRDVVLDLQEYFGASLRCRPVGDMAAMVGAVAEDKSGRQSFGILRDGQFTVAELRTPTTNLAIASLQPALDRCLDAGGAAKIDYVHGDDVLERLSSAPGNVGFYLPPLSKSQLFKSVILDGTLPRKTFSIGEARGKRFYVEARRIR